MADIYNPNDPKNRQNQMGGINAPQGQQAPQTVGGQQVQQAPGQSRFSNLQAFVRANQPASPEQGIAGKVGQAVARQEEAQKSAIGSAQGQVNQQASGELTRLGQGTEGSDYFANIRKGIEAGKLGDADVSNFAQLRQGTVQAPNVNNMQQLQQQTADIQKAGQMAGTEAGRFGLLQKTFARPGYSGGQQRLDQLLLQATPGSAKALMDQTSQLGTEAQQGLGGLNDLLTQQQGAVSSLASQRQQEATDLLAKQAGGLSSDLAIKAQAQTDLATSNQTLMQKISSGGELTGDEQKQADTLFRGLGLNPEDGFYNVFQNTPSGNYLNKVNAADISQVASPEARSKYNVLNQLAGGDTKLLGGLALEDKAAYNPNAVIDADVIKTNIAKAKQAVQDKLSSDPVANQVAARQQAVSAIQQMSPSEAVQRYAGMWNTYISDPMHPTEDDKQRILNQAQTLLGQSQTQAQKIQAEGGQFQTLKDLFSNSATSKNKATEAAIAQSPDASALATRQKMLQDIQNMPDESVFGGVSQVGATYGPSLGLPNTATKQQIMDRMKSYIDASQQAVDKINGVQGTAPPTKYSNTSGVL